MKKIITYIDIPIGELERHPLHIKMFGATEPMSSTLEWLHRSYEQFGKLKYVFAVQQVVDGATKAYIIDGFKSIQIFKQMGITTVKVAVLNLTEDADIAQVMIELQKSHHNSIAEEYGIYESLYAIFSKGKGRRMDLIELTNDDAEETGISEEETKKRRETVYDVIGRMCGVSRNRVMYVIKVGRINPWHFERIEKERYALYAAYLDCLAEEKGEEPSVPPAKAPMYESDPTQAPAYDATSATTHDGFTDETDYEVPVHNSANDIEDFQSEANIDDDGSESITINFKVNKDQLKDVDTTIDPQITVDASNPQFVTVILTFSKTN
jgi:hypothetical protein